jgi:predicted nucleic acid-binding protein
MEGLCARRTGRLGFQVLQEFYVTVTTKLVPGLSPELARLNVRQLLAWNPIAVNNRLLEEAWRLQDRFRLPWWDALIVAAAQVSDCRYLLSEDFQEGMEMGDLKVVNPFLHNPEEFWTSSNH